MSYNGWTNYETWVVNLRIDNEQGSQDFIRETAKEIYAEAKATDSWTREESARFRLSDWLRVLYDENLPRGAGSVRRPAGRCARGCELGRDCPASH